MIHRTNSASLCYIHVVFKEYMASQERQADRKYSLCPYQELWVLRGWFTVVEEVCVETTHQKHSLTNAETVSQIALSIRTRRHQKSQFGKTTIRTEVLSRNTQLQNWRAETYDTNTGTVTAKYNSMSTYSVGFSVAVVIIVAAAI